MKASGGIVVRLLLELILDLDRVAVSNLSVDPDCLLHCLLLQPEVLDVIKLLQLPLLLLLQVIPDMLNRISSALLSLLVLLSHRNLSEKFLELDLNPNVLILGLIGGNADAARACLSGRRNGSSSELWVQVFFVGSVPLFD